MAAPRSSAEHMTPDDWVMLGDYVKSLPFGKRGSQSVATKFDIPPRLVTEYCKSQRIPQSKQQLVEYFMATPDSLGLTRHQIAAKLGCDPSIVCRVMSAARYPKHDLTTGYVDYMRVLHTYESKKKVLCECTYCGAQRDILTNEIKYRPNAPWCKCKPAVDYHDRKRNKMMKTRRGPHGFVEIDSATKAKMAYEYWLANDETLQSCCKKFETCAESVRRYRKKMNLPHKHSRWIDCEQDT